jgi:transglutaminase-like putative cysteine protease
VAFRAEHDEILFRVAARVERLAVAPALDISPDLGRLGGEIADYRGLDGDAPHHFLGPSPRVAPTPETTAYAREQILPGMTAADAVRAVGLALHRDMKFDPDATNVDTPPSEAFARRHGVCQDFAQVMIAALRGIGIPAGYVSGFLRTDPPPGRPRLEGADAMHAWVRAWCGRQAGWTEYDPTNAVAAGTDHILVARGRDYGDVAPVKGVLRIAGEQKTEHAVDVVPVLG